MLSCSRCFSKSPTKSGIIKGRQRWKCKSCCYHYTISHRGASPQQKRQALELYLEGLGFRSIGRLIKHSHVSVYNWIKKFVEELEDLRRPNKVAVVEIDEMHSYVRNKKIAAESGRPRKKSTETA